MYAREPFARVTEKGMFDYATGRYSPTRFYNYVTKAWSSEAPKATVMVDEGAKPAIAAFHGLSYVQWARQGTGVAEESQIGEGGEGASGGRVCGGVYAHGFAGGGEAGDGSESV